MASAFWGGFAETMKNERLADSAQERELQKQRALKELEKEFGAEIVDPSLTRVEGNVEVRYNKYGTKIGERQLSPQEIEARKLEMDEARLGVQGKGLDVELKGKEVGSYDQRMALDEMDTKSAIAARQAGVAQGWERINIDRARLSKTDELQVDKVVQALSRVHGVGGVNSGDAMIERFNEELSGATTDQEKKMVIAEWMGTAQRLLDERNNTWKGAGNSGLPAFGLDGSVIQPRGPGN